MIDHPTIEAYVEAFAKAPRLAEMEVRSRDQGVLRLRRSLVAAERKVRGPTGISVQESHSTTIPLSPVISLPTGTVITSALVGVFRMLPRNPVQVTTPVTEGQSVGAVEVMRLSNDVISPISGKVVAIFVQDGQPVEFRTTII